MVVISLGAMAFYYNPAALQFLNQKTPQQPAGQNIKQVLILDPSDPAKVKAKVDVEVAAEPGSRALGLGNRDSLAPEAGMLFIFPKSGLYKFWMKGMRFPLDMIWIEGNKIVDISASVAVLNSSSDGPIPVYSPKTEVSQVLEVNSGYAAAHNIQIGDPVQYIAGGP